MRVEHATFRGPQGPIFPDCTLALEPGQRWAIVGPNGSGKGLLVAALMGKLGLLAGTLRHPFLEGDPRCADSIFGVLPPGTIALASMREHRQWLLARDFHQLRWHGSLAEGSATVAALLERNQVEQRNPFAVVEPGDAQAFAEARERTIARLELGPLLARPVVGLSNGELHRFVLARALLRRPRLLFLDDPLAGLDQRSRERLFDLVEELVANGTGVVFAAADERELPGATHVARLAQGRVVAAGPISAAARAPAPGRRDAFAIPARSDRRVPPLGPIAELTDVTVRQGAVVLLDGVSWRIGQGEHWALLGPNGSGKSTLLGLLLADNPQVYANEVRVAGQALGPGRSIWDQKSWLGWVSPELESHTPPAARVLDVVLSGFASSLGVHVAFPPDAVAGARAWLDDLGLGDLADAAFADLEPTARRLVLLARAAVHGPALLLLDEPCQGLDPRGARRLRDAIEAVTEALGAALVYVTHDVAELPGSVEQCLVLERGRVRSRGPRR